MLDHRPIDLELLPACASVNAVGELVIGGHRLPDLASEYGTPLFVYDLDEIRTNFREAFSEFGQGTAYATKAFVTGDIVELANECGLSLDVSTEGEYEMVRTAGFPAERVVVHGNNKSIALIHLAVKEGVQWIVIDNPDDIVLVQAACEQLDRTAAVVVRVNPGIEVHTHDYSATGNRQSKFGFPIWNGEANRAIDDVKKARRLDFRGLHTHIGSLVFDLNNFEQGLETLADIIAYSSPHVLIAGGGLGVRYTNLDIAPTFSEWAKTIRETLQRIGFEGRVLVEPGRSMVARAGLTVYGVGSVRTIDNRMFVAVDGGMSDNPRPLLYQSGYEAFLPDGVNNWRPQAMRLVGSHCESGDTIVADGFLHRTPVRGDLLVTPVTGAYGLSMASNYNRMRRPAVVYIDNGSVRLGIERESFTDMRRNDRFFLTD